MKDLDRFFEDPNSKSFHEADEDTIKDKNEESQNQKKDDLFPWRKFFE